MLTQQYRLQQSLPKLLSEICHYFAIDLSRKGSFQSTVLEAQPFHAGLILLPEIFQVGPTCGSSCLPMCHSMSVVKISITVLYILSTVEKKIA